jgi:hypothetical protein
VLRSEGDWQIIHYSAKGKYYDRASQYWITDQSTHASISWAGSLVNRNDVKMVGTIIEKNGASFYKESVYNVHKSSTRVVENSASCVGKISWAKDEPSSERSNDPQHLQVVAAPSDTPAPQAQPTVGGPEWSNDLKAAKQRMIDCIKRFPVPQDGAENAVQIEVRRYIATCGKDYFALLAQGGMTTDESVSFAQLETYEALGCQFANIDLDEFRHTPESFRTVTCSTDRFVPSKAKWWLVIYAAGRVSVVAGPYDHIDQCADSSEAHTMEQQNPSCELSAFSPVVGELGQPPAR